MIRCTSKSSILFILFFGTGIFFACTANPSDKMNRETTEQATSTEDSLAIIHSNEYHRVVELLSWYKKGNGLYGINSVEKYDRSNPDSPFVYIDDLEVATYLKRCRNSGFFTKNYIRND